MLVVHRTIERNATNIEMGKQQPITPNFKTGKASKFQNRQSICSDSVLHGRNACPRVGCFEALVRASGVLLWRFRRPWFPGSYSECPKSPNPSTPKPHSPNPRPYKPYIPRFNPLVSDPKCFRHFWRIKSPWLPGFCLGVFVCLVLLVLRNSCFSFVCLVFTGCSVSLRVWDLVQGRGRPWDPDPSFRLAWQGVTIIFRN